ncbi:MAG: DUF72 domain-containing protein [Acidobacteria bacterium]|jgi:uncharacterized protein YecE (DUF72 family)|nr:DUF72 domain-containing protein [Acidobacteriota bacterium]
MPLPNNMRIGTAGWSYKDWAGKVYPAQRPRGFHEAAYLARYFDTVEINTSFYRAVRPEHARLWALQVAFNQRFLFTVKLHRSFTHEQNPGDKDERGFRAMADVLAESGRLGAVLAQFPWSFKHTPENRAYVQTLLERFRGYPVVIEMRHGDWLSPPFLELLKEQGAAFCNIDQPTLSHGLPPTAVVTAPLAYFRLHGRNYNSWFKGGESENRNERYNYLYTAAELEPLRKKIGQAAGQAQTTYVVANNHFEGKAAANALQLMSMFLDKRVEAPPPLRQAYPELEPFVFSEAPAQQGLFTA